MSIRVRKWRRGLGLRIPGDFALELGLSAASEVEVTLEGRALVVTAAGEPRCTLEGLPEGVTPENLHAEVDAGALVVRELGAAGAVEDETAYLLRSSANRERFLSATRNIEEGAA